MRKSVFVILATLALTPALFAASATTANANNVTANVSGVCRIDTFNLTFGAYDPVVTNATVDLDTSAPINVFCTKGFTPLSITMGAGATAGAPANATTATRTMQGYTLAVGGVAILSKLDYEVFLDSTRSTVWSSGAGNQIVPAASTSKNTALTLAGGSAIAAYGRVFSGQDVLAGYYRDTIQATVNF